MSGPRVSLILLAFNQVRYVAAAVESCLAQVGEPIEIVLSDDASTDGTYAELERLAAAYRGPHSVRARRNPANLGIGAHYNVLLADTRGELLVTAAGDDVSTPDRVRQLAAAWDATGRQADLVSSHFVEMDAQGRLGRTVATDDLSRLTLARWCARRPYTVGATHAFSRRVMQRFGPFIDDVWYEDSSIALRALLTGGGVTVPEPLVHYRIGGTSHQPRTRDGERLVDWVRVQNRRVLAEIEQHRRDARLMGVEAPVAAALAPARTRETYLAAMMDAPDAGERWRACRAPSALPWHWRFRKLLTFTFPKQAAGLKRTKERWRGRR